jgi:hypothetical protein
VVPQWFWQTLPQPSSPQHFPVQSGEQVTQLLLTTSQNGLDWSQSSSVS